MDTSRWRESALHEAERAIEDASALLLASSRLKTQLGPPLERTAPLVAVEKLYLAVYHLLGVVRDLNTGGGE